MPRLVLRVHPARFVRCGIGNAGPVGILLAVVVMILVCVAFYLISPKGKDGKRWQRPRGGR